ncbi:transglutaminase superfamily protein [Novosphingobium sp. PhB165]|nr:transglutaminase superfamily protein [Novosphingobium sp. PhB165]
MSGHGLRRGVSFCAIGERYIFLDLEADRYFCLPQPLDRQFHRLTETGEAEPPVRQALQRIGVLSMGHGYPLTACTRRAAITASAQAQDGASASVPLGTARALANRSLWNRRVRTRALAANIADVIRKRENLQPARDAAAALQGVASAYRHAGLIRSTRGRCLPTSMALMSDLAKAGVCARMVMGVQLGPFSAHCWVEVGSGLVCEDAGTVAPYVPILVV